jgi:F-type H+-transporting ATPase subunit a
MEGLAEVTTYSFTLPWFDAEVTINPTTIITTWVIIIFMLILGKIAALKLNEVPSRRQSLLEVLIEWFQDTVNEAIGEEDGRKFLPFIATLFLFVLFCNWVNLIPRAQSPTRDLNTCLGLGLLVMAISHGFAIKKKGFLKYLKSYFKPLWILFPANVFSEISKVLSHSFRLFGNIFAGGIVIALVPWILVNLLNWWGVPLGIIFMPALNAFFGFFIGAIQAFVFALLAVAYIGVLCR